MQTVANSAARRLAVRSIACLLIATLGSTFSSSPVQADFEVDDDVVAHIVTSLPSAAAAQPASPRHVLIFTRTLGFRHDSIPAGTKAIQMLGEKTRAFTAVHSEDPGMFEAEALDQFDAVIMLNTTGECLAEDKGASFVNNETDARRKENLRRFVASGKGLMGIHSATDTMYSSKEYGDLIGGWFTGHPWHTEVPLKIDAPTHPLTAMFDAENGYVIRDEIYQFAPRDEKATFGGYQPYRRDALRVLVSLDADRFDVSAGKRTDRDYAISWIRTFDQGRVFYTVLGHNDFIFWDPVILKHYLAGIQFVLGDLPADATPENRSP